MSKRCHEQWVDVFKGWLIVLVVAGHFFGGAYHFEAGWLQRFQHYAFLWIYLFHMPAFFFLAGMMSSGRKIGWAEFLLAKFRRLVVPYFIFGLLSVLAYLLLANVFKVVADSSNDFFYSRRIVSKSWTMLLSLLHAGGWPNGQGFRMNSPLWFLPCMFSCLVAYRLVNQWCSNARSGMRLCLCAVLFALAHFLSINHVVHLPYGVDRVPFFLAYMVAGSEFARAKNLRSFMTDHRIPVLFFGLPVYTVICCLIPDPWSVRFELAWYVALQLLALYGIGLSYVLAQFTGLRLLSVCGSFSLVVLVLHKFPMMLSQVALGGQSYVVQFGVSVAGTLVLCVICGCLLRRYCPYVIGESHG